MKFRRFVMFMFPFTLFSVVYYLSSQLESPNMMESSRQSRRKMISSEQKYLVRTALLSEAFETHSRNQQRSSSAAPRSPAVPQSLHFVTTRKRKKKRHRVSDVTIRRNTFLPNYTVVTGLFDIGRGTWWHYRRPYEYYLSFLTNLLNLDVNLVVFADEKSGTFAQEYRLGRGLKNKTRVVIMTLEGLELFRFRNEAKRIIDREQERWSSKWDPAMRTHPESSNVEYNLVVNSKPYFMNLAAKENFFHSEYYYWFDAGYGHNIPGVFPRDNRWVPRQLMRSPAKEKITVIQLFKNHPPENFNLQRLYRQDITVISGGFFGGRKDVVIGFYELYTAKFTELLRMGYVDDDQTLLVLLINQYPNMFNIVCAQWFDAIKLFQ